MRSLLENIKAEQNRQGDLLVSGIISLLLADVSANIHPQLPLVLSSISIQAHYGASANFRYHLKGVHSLVTLRGGVRGLSGTKSLDQLLLSFTLCVPPPLMTGRKLVYEPGLGLTYIP